MSVSKAFRRDMAVIRTVRYRGVVLELMGLHLAAAYYTKGCDTILPRELSCGQQEELLTR